MKIFKLLLIALFFLAQAGSLFADNLPAVAATGSDEISQTGAWEDIVTTAGLTVSNGDKVMVIASFTSKTTAGDNVTRDVTFRIGQDIASTPSYSNVIIRHMTGTGTGDEGIGTLVYVFTIASGTSKTYTLQHSLTIAKATLSDATITAINLTTSNTVALDNSFKAITTGVTTESTTFVEVTGTVSDAITLPVTGGLYFAASINSKSATGVATNKGQFQMQYKKESGGIWTDLGKAVQRSFTNPEAEGITNLVAVLENQPAGDYYFRLVHRISGGSFTLETFNTSVVGLALSTSGGRAFSTFKDEPADQVNATTGFVIASTNTFTAAGTQAFLHAQYGMSADALSDAPGFRFTASGGSVIQNINNRHISSATDAGSGGQVGLISGLTASTSYSAYFETQSTTGVTLTTSNILFVGFQLTDAPAPGSWDGSESSVWELAANWADVTVPISTTNVYIPGSVPNYPHLNATTGEGVCATLDIASGATLDIEDDGSLTVSGAITNNGTLTIESTATGTGSLIFGSGTPNATVQRYLSDNMWHCVTPLTTGTTVNDFHWNNAPQSWLLTHAESDNSWAYLIPLNTALNVGQGYMVWLDQAVKSPATATMTGNLQSADLSPALAYTDASHGINLIGNPFSCAIDYDLGTWGSNTGGFVYVWDNVIGDYRVSGFDLTDNIIPEGQGFFVAATSAGPFNIPAASRVHSTQAFYKSGNNGNSADDFVRIQLDGNGFGNRAYVGFPDFGTGGMDYKGDARKIYSSDDSPQLFAVENNIELCVNSNKPLLDGESKTVPLHLIQIVDGEYSLTISDLDQLEYNSISLEDVKTGVNQDLKTFPVYTFTASSNDAPERFLLHFKNSPFGLGQELEQAANIQIYAYDNQVYIRSTEEAINQDGTVSIYDMMGRVLIQQSLEKSELVRIPLNITSNYVVVKVIKEGSLKTEMLFIK